MSKYNWRNGFALGLTVGIVLTIIFSISLEMPIHDKSTPVTEGEHQQQIEPQVQRWWIIDRLIFGDDSLAQWLMVGLTLVAVILVFLTFKDTRRMASETTRVGEAQVRAYLSWSLEEFVEPRDGDLGYAKIKVSNSGNSPAIAVSVVVAWQPNTPIQPDHLLSIGTLSANEERFVRIKVPTLGINSRRLICQANYDTVFGELKEPSISVWIWSTDNPTALIPENVKYQ